MSYIMNLIKLTGGHSYCRFTHTDHLDSFHAVSKRRV